MSSRSQTVDGANGAMTSSHNPPRDLPSGNAEVDQVLRERGVI